VLLRVISLRERSLLDISAGGRGHVSNRQKQRVCVHCGAADVPMEGGGGVSNAAAGAIQQPGVVKWGIVACREWVSIHMSLIAWTANSCHKRHA
jgi:hypothetical protein